MNKFASVLLIAGVCLLAVTNATPVYQEEEAGTGRIWQATTTALSFNSTTADMIAAAALAGGLIALLYAIAFSGDTATGYGYGGYGGGYGGYGYGGYGQSSFNSRSDKKLVEQELSNSMLALAEAFKKFEVEDLNCQLYVACEASQVHKHEENGVLAKTVFGVMRTMNKHGKKAVQAQDEYVASLLDAYNYGDQELKGGNKDACVSLRDTCYNSRK